MHNYNEETLAELLRTLSAPPEAWVQGCAGDPTRPARARRHRRARTCRPGVPRGAHRRPRAAPSRMRATTLIQRSPTPFACGSPPRPDRIRRMADDLLDAPVGELHRRPRAGGGAGRGLGGGGHRRHGRRARRDGRARLEGSLAGGRRGDRAGGDVPGPRGAARAGGRGGLQGRADDPAPAGGGLGALPRPDASGRAREVGRDPDPDRGGGLPTWRASPRCSSRTETPRCGRTPSSPASSPREERGPPRRSSRRTSAPRRTMRASAMSNSLVEAAADASKRALAAAE